MPPFTKTPPVWALFAASTSVPGPVFASVPVDAAAPPLSVRKVAELATLKVATPPGAIVKLRSVAAVPPVYDNTAAGPNTKFPAEFED